MSVSQRLVGNQALAFVRQRHGLPGGDIDRIKRQQQFLGSVFRTATSNHFLFNPAAVLRLLSAIKGAMTLDHGTSLTDLEKLAIRMRGLDPSKVTFETIPQRGLQPTDTNLGQIIIDSAGAPELIPNGQSNDVGYVQVVDQAGFNAMIAKLKDQKPPPTPKASAAPKPKVEKVTVPPSQVLVDGRERHRRSGLAGQVTRALAPGELPHGRPCQRRQPAAGVRSALRAGQRGARRSPWPQPSRARSSSRTRASPTASS